MSAQGADQKISNQVLLKLNSRGIRSPSIVTVSTKNGEVTLSGSVQYAHQKGAAVQAASGVPGVRRVTDQMKVGAKRKYV
jgi:osmotically-inducible protein OsmY